MSMIESISVNRFIYPVKVLTRPIRHGLPKLIQQVKRQLGYDYTQWARVVMYRELFEFVSSIHPEELDALEISPGVEWQKLGFKSFLGIGYPDFDICKDKLDERFDVIVADQVFEHLLWPYRAGKNVLKMLNPGGYFIITTPFLIQMHACPIDCSRWTETGLKYFLAECGFELEEIDTGSWGNRSCVRANLKPNHWEDRGWSKSLNNERDYPVAVWAIARKIES